MNKVFHLVRESDVRPARRDGTCFYCRSPLGKEHAKGCVCRTRTVVMAYTLTVVRRVREDEEPDQIESHQNSSSFCQSNIISELTFLNASRDKCLCGQIVAKFIGEATEEQEASLGVIGLEESTDERSAGIEDN